MMKKLNEVSLRQKECNTIILRPNDVSKNLELLVKSTPEEIDIRAEDRLQQIFDGRLSIKKKRIFPKGAESKVVVTSMDRPEGVTENQILTSKKALMLLTQPGPATLINEALNKLAVTSTTYEGDKQNIAFKIKVYMAELKKFPIDSVISAINSGWRVFPNLPDLISKVEEFSTNRKDMLRMVNKWEPWSVEDEINLLKEDLKCAIFDAAYYEKTFQPAHSRISEKAKAVIPMLESLIENLTGEEISKKSDEDVKTAIDELNDANEQFKKDQKDMKKKIKTLREGK